MVVNVIIDSIPPRITPAIPIKEIFHDRCGVEITRQRNGSLVQHQRPTGVIRDHPVVFEFGEFGLANADKPFDAIA